MTDTTARACVPALEFQNISCRFAVPGGAYTATQNVSFAIGDGEFVSVVGPSGCG